jgi:hypothetical protein
MVAITDQINGVNNGAVVSGFECADQGEEIDLTEKIAPVSRASASKKRGRNPSVLLISSDEDIEGFRLPK